MTDDSAAIGDSWIFFPMEFVSHSPSTPVILHEYLLLPTALNTKLLPFSPFNYSYCDTNVMSLTKWHNRKSVAVH